VLKFFFLTACILMFSASFAHADFYRWVDKDGKEFFTNDPKHIPQEYRNSASTVKTDESRVSVGNNTPASERKSVKSPDHKDKYGRNEEYWRKRAEKYRRQLRDYQYEYDMLLKKERAEKENPKVLTKKRKKAMASLEKKKAQLESKIEKTRRILEIELPEEARKADAYPGWVRE
jgi:hypothetical protein